MKVYKKLLLGISFLLIPSITMGNQDSCIIRLTGQLVQDILDAINIIKPKIISIQININQIIENLATCCDNLRSQIDNITVNVSVSGLDQVVTAVDSIVASCCAALSSQIDHITVTVSVSGLDQVITRIDRVATCCDAVNSKLDILIRTESINDRLILSDLDACCSKLSSQIEHITVTVSISGIDQLISRIDRVSTCCDIVNSKIGTLNDPGTCLDSLIDVPAGINNLNLTIIQLLKTILLELRGCSPC